MFLAELQRLSIIFTADHLDGNLSVIRNPGMCSEACKSALSQQTHLLLIGYPEVHITDLMHYRWFPKVNSLIFRAIKLGGEDRCAYGETKFPHVFHSGCRFCCSCFRSEILLPSLLFSWDKRNFLSRSEGENIRTFVVLRVVLSPLSVRFPVDRRVFGFLVKFAFNTTDFNILDVHN